MVDLLKLLHHLYMDMLHLQVLHNQHDLFPLKTASVAINSLKCLLTCRQARGS